MGLFSQKRVRKIGIVFGIVAVIIGGFYVCRRGAEILFDLYIYGGTPPGKQAETNLRLFWAAVKSYEEKKGCFPADIDEVLLWAPALCWYSSRPYSGDSEIAYGLAKDRANEAGFPIIYELEPQGLKDNRHRAILPSGVIVFIDPCDLSKDGALAKPTGFR